MQAKTTTDGSFFVSLLVAPLGTPFVKNNTKGTIKAFFGSKVHLQTPKPTLDGKKESTFTFAKTKASTNFDYPKLIEKVDF